MKSEARPKGDGEPATAASSSKKAATIAYDPPPFLQQLGPARVGFGSH